MKTLVSFIIVVFMLSVFDLVIIPNNEKNRHNRMLLNQIQAGQQQLSYIITGKNNQIACLKHELHCAMREDTTFPCIALHGDTLIGNVLVENPLSCDNY